MVRRGRVPLRLDIVGLNPVRFNTSLRSAQALVESKTKGSVSRIPSEQSSTVPGQEMYDKIALIAIDFQRAYGRAVEIRVFEHSANRFFERLLAMRGSIQAQGPEFLVNGVIIFKGIPTSFSQLDEAIENAFGRS